MRRLLRNADTLRSQRHEHEVLPPKRCRMNDKQFEMLLFLYAKIKSFLENSFAINNDLIIVILTKRITESAMVKILIHF